MSTFKTEIKLGEKYRDKATGFEGTATSAHFYEHGCERVVLKGTNKHGEIVTYTFDAPELEHVKTGRSVGLLERKTGGPHDGGAPLADRATPSR